MKILGNYSFYWGILLGGEAPSRKMGIHKAKPYFQGG